MKFQRKIKTKRKITYCDYEYHVFWDDIVALPEKETSVPIKICSFDIEASSSHGDFPMAIKNYNELAGEIITYWNANYNSIIRLTDKQQKSLIKQCILTAFKIKTMDGISEVYTKSPVRERSIRELIHLIQTKPIKDVLRMNRNSLNYESKYDSENSSDYSDDEDDENW